MLATDRGLALPELLAPMTLARLSRAAAALLALVLAVVVAGCGGSSKSSGPSQAEWADGMCSAFVDWQNNLKAAGQKVSGGNLSKSTLEDTANAISDANKQLRSDLDGLGKPPTPTADQAKSALTQLTEELSKSVDQIRSALSGSGGVQAAVTAAAGAIQAMSQDVQTTATKLDSLSKDDSWKKAFQSSESCKKLSG